MAMIDLRHRMDCRLLLLERSRAEVRVERRVVTREAIDDCKGSTSSRRSTAGGSLLLWQRSIIVTLATGVTEGTVFSLSLAFS